LFKFRQCQDYSEQSKLYFEHLTFAKLRCLLKREYFDFVCSHFHQVFLTLSAYIFIITNSKKRNNEYSLYIYVFTVASLENANDVFPFDIEHFHYIFSLGSKF